MKINESVLFKGGKVKYLDLFKERVRVKETLTWQNNFNSKCFCVYIIKFNHGDPQEKTIFPNSVLWKATTTGTPLMIQIKSPRFQRNNSYTNYNIDWILACSDWLKIKSVEHGKAMF